MAFTIRRAERRDLETVLSVLAEAAGFMRARLGAWAWSDGEIRAETIGALLSAHELIVACSADQIVACMALQARDERFWPDRQDDRALYLHRLAVRRAFAGGGVTAELVTWAGGEARRQGRDRLRLDCAPAPSLCAVYERLGFTQIDTRLIPKLGADFRVARFEMAL